MSAAKRHISSLLASSRNDNDDLNGVPTGQSAKRPRIQELVPDDAHSSVVRVAANEGESLAAEDDANDQSSVLSTSSSEPSSMSSSSDDDGEDEHGIGPPASSHCSPKAEQPGSLRARLKEFLPQLHKANETLDSRKASAFEILEDKDKAEGQAAGGAEESQQPGVVNDDDEDESDGPYIEMNLGLGVLEERRTDDTSSSSSDEDSSSEGGDETHILGRLMGRQDDKKDVGIQEL